MFVYYGVVVREEEEEEDEEEGCPSSFSSLTWSARRKKWRALEEERGMKDVSEFETAGRQLGWVVAVGWGREMHLGISTYLSAVDELHGGLAKEEVDVVLVLQGVDKVRGWKRE